MNGLIWSRSRPTGRRRRQVDLHPALARGELLRRGTGSACTSEAVRPRPRASSRPASSRSSASSRRTRRRTLRAAQRTSPGRPTARAFSTAACRRRRRRRSERLPAEPGHRHLHRHLEPAESTRPRSVAPVGERASVAEPATRARSASRSRRPSAASAEHEREQAEVRRNRSAIASRVSASGVWSSPEAPRERGRSRPLAERPTARSTTTAVEPVRLGVPTGAIRAAGSGRRQPRRARTAADERRGRRQHDPALLGRASSASSTCRHPASRRLHGSRHHPGIRRRPRVVQAQSR